MKSFFVFLSLLILSMVLSCSTNKSNFNSNVSCLKTNDKGKLVRREYGDNYYLVDSTGLFLFYSKNTYVNYHPVRYHTSKVAYFSQTKCGELRPLDYWSIKKLYKNTLPEFVKEVKEQNDHDLILPFDSINKTPRIIVMLKKYLK